MAITKRGSCIIKYASRWMDFISKLSPASRKRLEDSGIIKPITEYITGINRGSAHIAKRHGYKIENLQTNNQGKDSLIAFTDPNNKLIHTDIKKIFSNDVDQALFETLVTRHEVYEMQAAERAIRKLKSNPKKYIPKTIRNFETVNYSQRGRYTPENLTVTMPPRRKAVYNTSHTGFLLRNGAQQYGPNSVTGHLDMDVLFKERKLLERIPYPQNGAVDKIRRMRYGTGEYQYLDITGNYGEAPYNINKLERFNKKNARSVLQYGKNPVFVNSADAVTLEPLF